MYVLKFTPRERVLSVFSNHLILALSYESLSCDNDTEQSCAVQNFSPHEMDGCALWSFFGVLIHFADFHGEFATPF